MKGNILQGVLALCQIKPMTLETIQSEVTSRDMIMGLLHDGAFKEVAQSLSEDIAKLTNDELENLRKPTEIDYFLRKNLWKQIEIAHKTQSLVTMSSVYTGICSSQNFTLLMKNPLRVAWMLIRPTQDMERLEYGLSLGLTRLLEFVAKPVSDDSASAFLKAIEILLNRVHGPVIQRIEAKHAHLNMNKPIQSADPKDLSLKLKELKQDLIEPKDVTPKEVKAE